MRICELREKEVINICNCKCLGFVIDVEIDECTGCVRALIIPGCGRMFGMFGKGNDLIIPWKQIVRIGPDIILVELKEPRPVK
ncbi:MAG: YlmC/YmxH family sporulation protein [Lachnospiraceae bacterium]